VKSLRDLLHAKFRVPQHPLGDVVLDGFEQVSIKDTAIDPIWICRLSAMPSSQIMNANRA
jgi:hypothetical protein